MATVSKSQNLHDILNRLEASHKKDIYDYAGGHLNENKLPKSKLDVSVHTPWSTSRMTVTQDPSPRPKSRNKSSSVRQSKSLRHDGLMTDRMLDFAAGSAGALPDVDGQQTDKLPPLSRLSHAKSLYSELEDGILIEEAPPQHMSLAKFRCNIMSSEQPVQSTSPRQKQAKPNLNLQQLQKVQFSGQFGGITRKEQYQKLKSIENTVVRKKDTHQQNIMSGTKAVEHIERKLDRQLHALQAYGTGPNFHRLQLFSEIFADVAKDSPTFGHILTEIKQEYDSYLSRLLNSQSSTQHQVLQEQIENMTQRGTAKPKVLEHTKEKVNKAEQDASHLLQVNQRLRQELRQEKELLDATPELEQPVQLMRVYRDEPPVDLSDEIEHVKALILEKLDELSILRTKLREDYVPSTVCAHLEQCIKETEVEVQKNLKQNEYFDTSITDMMDELKNEVMDADTSERDARRVWKKVTSTRPLRRVAKPTDGQAKPDSEDDDEGDDEEKWDWYIS